MIRIKEEEKKKYFHMFDEYTHSVPVIFSSLEGQYDGALYVDDVENTKIAILFTQFAFHFIAGDFSAKNVIEIVDNMIFKQYLNKSNEKEAIVFSPNKNWDMVLDEVFKKYNGIKDKRNIFKLNKTIFNQRYNNKTINLEVEKKIILEKDNDSKNDYPVCRIYKENSCISYCSGFMIGNKNAEIDVATDEKHRGLGYAKEAAFSLIHELIKSDLEPNWCSWSYKEDSKKLAESLGYELVEVVPAHIWVEEECGKLL